MTSKVSRRVFGAGVLASGLLGKSASSPAQEAPKRGGTLVATWGGGEPQACYVPAGGGSSPTFSSSKLFERLGNRKMDGGFEGELAEAWNPAADFKSYTIKIRKGVKFHDGKDMTTDDVDYSIGEIWKKHAAASTLTDFAGVEAPDADTVVVKFSKPVPEYFFSSLLCGNVNYIVPKHVYAGSDPATNAANNAPIATGPWKFKEWVRGSHFEYVKNDAYWRRDMPYMDRLIIRYVRDPAGRAAAMEAGDIQIGVFNPVAPPDIKRLTATGKFVATPKGYEESVWSTTFEVNMRNPLFAKREVRQAMFHAIDRNFIAKTVYYGYARPGTSPIFSPNKEFFTADTYKTNFDPKKAASLLDAAGFPRRPPASASRSTCWRPAGSRRTARSARTSSRRWRMSASASTSPFPTGRPRSSASIPTTISTWRSPTRPIPRSRCRSRRSTTPATASRRVFPSAMRRASIPTRSMRWSRRSRSRPTPPSARRWWSSSRRLSRSKPPTCRWSSSKSITVASTKVQNHSNDPNYLAASWYDIWLAS